MIWFMNLRVIIMKKSITIINVIKYQAKNDGELIIRLKLWAIIVNAINPPHKIKTNKSDMYQSPEIHSVLLPVYQQKLQPAQKT